VCQLHCLAASRFFGNMMHDRQKASICGIVVGCGGRWGFGFIALKQPEAVARIEDVQRFERQGRAWRVST